MACSFSQPLLPIPRRSRVSHSSPSFPVFLTRLSASIFLPLFATMGEALFGDAGALAFACLASPQSCVRAEMHPRGSFVKRGHSRGAPFPLARKSSRAIAPLERFLIAPSSQLAFFSSFFLETACFTLLLWALSRYVCYQDLGHLIAIFIIRIIQSSAFVNSVQCGGGNEVRALRSSLSVKRPSPQVRAII